MQVTTFIYLCDVDESNGATAAVPKRYSADIPLGQRRTEPGELRDCEVLACGKAGTVLVYSTEVFHRATSMTGHQRLALHGAGRLQGRRQQVDQQAGVRTTSASTRR